ncbi:MAG: GNAT family N-acetyltransferase [Parabacteroides sp.]
MNNKTNYFDEKLLPSKKEKQIIVDFLYNSLEKFGDPKEAIMACVEYALKQTVSFGGLIAMVKDMDRPDNPIVSCVVYNRTGMNKYIPENILVYIATDKNYRGQGIGRALIEESLKRIDGSVALHCDPQNPAKLLYEKLGFASKYLEMRLYR